MAKNQNIFAPSIAVWLPTVGRARMHTCAIKGVTSQVYRNDEQRDRENI